jgi:hypothetical protein
MKKDKSKFVCLGSVTEKNCKIQNEINKRIKIQIENVKSYFTTRILKIYCYVKQRHGHVLRERKVQRNFLKAKAEKTDGIREELKMEETQNQTDRSRLKLFGNVNKMAEHRIPKILEI